MTSGTSELPGDTTYRVGKEKQKIPAGGMEIHPVDEKVHQLAYYFIEKAMVHQPVNEM